MLPGPHGNSYSYCEYTTFTTKSAHRKPGKYLEINEWEVSILRWVYILKVCGYTLFTEGGNITILTLIYAQAI